MIDLNDVLLAMSNIPVDDPIAEIWGRQMQGGYKIIEYTGTLPITINTNGDALLDYRIYGASGGVGVATENLFDISSATANKYVNPANGVEMYFYDGAYMLSDYIDVSDVDTITISSTVGDTRHTTGAHLNLYDANKNWVRGYIAYVADSPNSKKSFTKDVSNVSYVRVDYSTRYLLQNSLVKGSTAPANYIPYGYKLPMTVSEGDTTQTVPVYIGENQLDSVEGVSDYVDKSSGKIVRRIKEYTFTGNEAWDVYGVGFYTGIKFNDAITTRELITISFSHFTARSNCPLGYMLNSRFGSDCGCFRVDEGNVMVSSTSNFTTVEECKAYFKAQYDNGTPVKISYWLKTPVEEDPPVPLPNIPTIDGTTVIDYDGTPKPSQMYIKYKGKG